MTTMTIAAPGPRASDPAYAVAVNEALERLFALPATDATELLLIRHAEPDLRRAALGRGPLDPPLTERGRCQAMRLAMRLRPLEMEAIYTSTARAALETAALVAAAKDMPMIRAPQLRDVAVHTARNGHRDPERLATEVVVRFLNRPRWDALPGVEPTRQFRHRAIQALEGIVSRHPVATVVVVTHHSVINAYLSMILDIGRDMFFLPDHSSVSVVRVVRDLYGVRNLNDTAHLLPAFSPR